MNLSAVQSEFSVEKGGGREGRRERREEGEEERRGKDEMRNEPKIFFTLTSFLTKAVFFLTVPSSFLKSSGSKDFPYVKKKKKVHK